MKKARWHTDIKNDTSLLSNEIQLILSQKRTALSLLNTGIAVFAFPLSVLSLLIATSKSYHLSEVNHFLLPLLIITFCLVALGIYLVIKAILQIRYCDSLIYQIKQQHSAIAKWIK